MTTGVAARNNFCLPFFLPSLLVSLLVLMFTLASAVPQARASGETAEACPKTLIRCCPQVFDLTPPKSARITAHKQMRLLKKPGNRRDSCPGEGLGGSA